MMSLIAQEFQLLMGMTSVTQPSANLAQPTDCLVDPRQSHPVHLPRQILALHVDRPGIPASTRNRENYWSVRQTSCGADR
ncbi:hypothetical protein Q7C18_16715 [Nesterenkonia sp. CL21]|uniref:hypothetical protein n=1 Tax=Nesterenkonia sp. CL21 TaxID=3064894 RepID=UPI00287B5645|nr:hypothetical protein [Nesterenkonia sp. CL21]MDS2174342.1 hypothetical protein [Nesterenkonia sp. CL21]